MPASESARSEKRFRPLEERNAGLWSAVCIPANSREAVAFRLSRGCRGVIPMGSQESKVEASRAGLLSSSFFSVPLCPGGCSKRSIHRCHRLTQIQGSSVRPVFPNLCASAQSVVSSSAFFLSLHLGGLISSAGVRKQPEQVIFSAHSAFSAFSAVSSCLFSEHSCLRGYSKRSIRIFHRFSQIEGTGRRLVFPHLRASARSVVGFSFFFLPLCLDGSILLSAKRVRRTRRSARTWSSERGDRQ